MKQDTRVLVFDLLSNIFYDKVLDPFEKYSRHKLACCVIVKATHSFMKLRLFMNVVAFISAM